MNFRNHEDASKKLTEASEIVTEKVQTGLEVVKEKAVEYELEAKAKQLSSNIQEGVTTGYTSVKTFVEETAQSIQQNNEQAEAIERKREAKRKALEMKVYPWSLIASEQEFHDELRARILDLSNREDVFSETAPESFEFRLRKMLPFAYGVLREDKELADRRFEFVPGKVKEKVFWRNYFYRVSLVRKQIGVSPLEPDNIELYKVEGKSDVIVESLEEEVPAKDASASIEELETKSEKSDGVLVSSPVVEKAPSRTKESEAESKPVETKEAPAKKEDDSDDDLDLDALEYMLGDVETDDEIDDAELENYLLDVEENDV